ncbi:type IV pilin [Halorubrum sp. JWXQ-INN 858]|nr:type IV pilin [Halorubrum sp. JWXQ-INN 858]
MAPIGVALLVAVAVVLAAGIAGATMQVAPGTTTGTVPTASLSLSAAGDRLTLTHRAGDRLDAGTIELRVSVDGTPLNRQPPVPFFSARGFRPGPTGPFNAASEDTWTAGQSASLRVAGTNAPQLRAGRTVTVRVIVDGRTMTTLETTVEP